MKTVKLRKSTMVEGTTEKITRQHVGLKEFAKAVQQAHKMGQTCVDVAKVIGQKPESIYQRIQKFQKNPQLAPFIPSLRLKPSAQRFNLEDVKDVERVRKILEGVADENDFSPLPYTQREPSKRGRKPKK